MYLYLFNIYKSTVSYYLSLPKVLLSFIYLFTPGWLICTTLAIQHMVSYIKYNNIYHSNVYVAKPDASVRCTYLFFNLVF